jgi:small conductance mechanosensitive channel
MDIFSIFHLDFGVDNLEIGPISIPTSSIETVINKSIKIIFIVVFMYLVIKIGNKIIDKFIKRQIQSNKKFTMDRKKAKTIGGILKSTLKYSTYFIGIALIIGNIFSTMSLAAAGFGTVAIGLGSQSLIKDIINGFFILFEDQYGVGEHVTISGFEGIVENIGIRTTVIRGFSGDVHLIPNGSIVQVTNHSRGNMRFTVDVLIPYGENVENVISLLKNICSKFEKDNKEVTEPINVLGITSFNNTNLTIGIVGKSKPLSQWNMERLLRGVIIKEMIKNGIKPICQNIEG